MEGSFLSVNTSARAVRPPGIINVEVEASEIIIKARAKWTCCQIGCRGPYRLR